MRIRITHEDRYVEGGAAVESADLNVVGHEIHASRGFWGPNVFFSQVCAGLLKDGWARKI